MAGGIDLHVSVTGQAGVAEMFRRAHPAIRGKVRDAIKREALALIQSVQAVLSTPLSSRSTRPPMGRLRAGMTHRFAEDGESVGELVWNKAQRGKARYGFMLAAGRMSGYAKVGAYTRRVKAADVHAYERSSSGRSRRRRVATGVAFVKAHRRNIRLPPRPFIAAAFESRRAAARAAIERAVAEGVAEAQGVSGGGGI